jgi:hypothetical protein
VANPLQIDPDVGIPDLIRRLTADGKRLLTDEIRLAKLETKDGVSRGGRGALRLGIAFGIGVVALTAFTLFLTTLIGRVANGHMWLGAIVTGVLELVVSILVMKRGLKVLAEPSYSLEQTRETIARLKD